MRFLITCYKLDLSGSSTYTYTLATELQKRGHRVDVFSPLPEIIGDKLKKIGINVYENPMEIIDKDYFCSIIQHNILALMIRKIKPDTPMVFISHGILFPQAFLEYPPSIDINIQKYIAVSEEVRNNLISNCRISFSNIEIVRNFVDIKRFQPHRKISSNPKTVLLLSNHSSNIYSVVKEACKKLKLKLLVIGKHKKVFETEKYINKADIVISLGRGILEAMSCGRAAIVYGYQGGDGMVTKENLNELKKYNFSGRMFKKKFGIFDLIQEIRKYKSTMGEINRKIVLSNFNSSTLSEKIIEVCKHARNNFSPKVISIPYNELIWFQNIIKSDYDRRLKKRKKIARLMAFVRRLFHA